DAIDYAAKDAKLGGRYAVRYFAPPTSVFQKLFMGFGNSASARVLAWLGLDAPQSWLQAVPRLAPELQLLEHAQPGKPLTYAYCFCRIY
ncbi:MAG TPA: signal peptide peptidase SppA, partial [Rhodanobacteraceae bacterium]|nr:signal peptide peptidase SppA [Rhodanobacteraceae bacterium]